MQHLQKMPVKKFLSRVMGHVAHRGLVYCLKLFFLETESLFGEF